MTGQKRAAKKNQKKEQEMSREAKKAKSVKEIEKARAAVPAEWGKIIGITDKTPVGFRPVEAHLMLLESGGKVLSVRFEDTREKRIQQIQDSMQETKHGFIAPVGVVFVGVDEKSKRGLDNVALPTLVVETIATLAGVSTERVVKELSDAGAQIASAALRTLGVITDDSDDIVTEMDTTALGREAVGWHIEVDGHPAETVNK